MPGLWGQHRLELEPFVHRAASLVYRAVELMGKRPHLSVLDAGPSRLDVRPPSRGKPAWKSPRSPPTPTSPSAAIRKSPRWKSKSSMSVIWRRLGNGFGARVVRVLHRVCNRIGGLQPRLAVVRAGSSRMCGGLRPARPDSGRAESPRCGRRCGELRRVPGRCGPLGLPSDVQPVGPCAPGRGSQGGCRAIGFPHGADHVADSVRLPRWTYQPGFMRYKRTDAQSELFPSAKALWIWRVSDRPARRSFQGYVACECVRRCAAAGPRRTWTGRPAGVWRRSNSGYGAEWREHKPCAG